MNFVNEDIITQSRISVTNLLQEIGPEEVREEIIAGLTAEKKYISSKYFYNKAGSELFEEITALEEYYPTRTEMSILERIAPGLMNAYKGFDIIELGSGDSSKISMLFQAVSPSYSEALHYLPLDISQPAILASSEELVKKFPNINIDGYAVDFTTQFELVGRDRPALICFFGGTIGNFEWEASIELLQNISRMMKRGDILLLGTDLVKPELILHAAYNDARGITAAFNRNILNSVNDLIESDFREDDFEHLAFFSKEKSRIEMHLVARRDLSVQSPYLREAIRIQKGEAIHTENSHKYKGEHIREMAAACDLEVIHTHTDDRGWFALSEFQRV